MMKQNMSKEENRLVVIGNGPSLRDFDFKLLDSLGVDTLGMNSAYRYWYRINWFPTYYCCLDPVVIDSHHKNIFQLVNERRIKFFFLRANIFDYYPELKNNSNVFTLDQYIAQIYERDAKKYNIPFHGHYAFNTTNINKITTGAYSVRFGIMLGYKKIFLLGIDLDYVEILDESKNVGGIKLQITETPQHNPNYFFDDYQQAGDLYQIPNPSVHGGNLHYQAFEVMKDDIVKFNMGVRITNCNKASKLYHSKLFPFLSIEKINDNNNLTGLVVPTMEKELDIIITNFKKWDQVGFTPYETYPEVPFTDLIFLFNSDIDDRTSQLIKEAYHSTKNVKKSFSSLVFKSAGLAGEDDVYSQAYLNKSHQIMMQMAPPGGYKAGPNNMFYYMCLNLMEHEYILQMESDCFPVRPNWLGRAQEIVKNYPHHFWIMGSIYRGDSGLDYSFRTHINGNAFYAVGFQSFREFIAKNLKPFLDSYIRNTDARIAYDCGISLFFNEKNSWRFLQKNFHKIVYTEYMQNYAGNSLLTGGDKHEVQNLINDFPDTFLLHGKLLSD